jgi:protein AroM
LAKVGLLTIGQSPRDDITSEIRPLFLPYLRILEAGLLDDLSPEEIRRLRPAKRETHLVTRLRGGSQVELSEKRVGSLLPEFIESAKKNMRLNAVGLLCTNDFPKMKFSFPVIFPFDSLQFIINEILHARRLGVVVPLETQIRLAEKKWKREKVAVEARSPYTGGKSWEKIAGKFHREKADAVILDCIGYSMKDRMQIQNLLSSPILLPRVILAHAVNQLF